MRNATVAEPASASDADELAVERLAVTVGVSPDVRARSLLLRSAEPVQDGRIADDVMRHSITAWPRSTARCERRAIRACHVSLTSRQEASVTTLLSASCSFSSR
eukprot:5081126-Prymnesium_polylepis.1